MYYNAFLFAEYNQGIKRSRLAYEGVMREEAEADRRAKHAANRARQRAAKKLNPAPAVPAVRVQVPKPPPRVLLPCGTNGAYYRHLRKREDACTPCLDAHVEHNSEWRSNARTKQNAGM